MSYISPETDPGNLLRDHVLSLRRQVLALGVLSFALTAIGVGVAAIVLALVDSGLPSRSLPSIGGLVAMAFVLIAFGIFLAAIRRHSLHRLVDVVDTRLDSLVPAMLTVPGDHALRDGLAIARQRRALTGMIGSRAVLAMFELAALPFYLAILFALGWPLGLTLLATAIAAAIMLKVCWRGVSDIHRDAAGARLAYQRLAATADREAVALAGQGIAAEVAAMLRSDHLSTARADRAAAARRHAFAGSIAAIAIGGGIVLVFVGAARIVETQATIGTLIFAAAIFAAALRPFATLAASAHILAEGRAAWHDILARLTSWTPAALTIALPPPSRALSLEKVALFRPGTRQPLLQQISAHAAAGEIIAVVGPSGVGKSALLRTLAVRETTPVGTVRLDGCEIGQWPVGDLNRHIGYLPQEIDLLEGTVAENIARFDPLAAPQAVLAAGQGAGIHDRVVRLEHGYDTPVGPGGRHLPLALRQRVGLARALYGDPFVLLLDDPAAHLDAREAVEIVSTLQAAAGRGAVVLVATGSPRLIDIADHVLMLRNGGMVDFGPREAVRARIAGRTKPTTATRGIPAAIPADA